MATKKKAPARKAPAKKAPAKAGGRTAFKAGGPRGGKKAAGRNPERKLPRKYGPRRKTPKSIGREAAPPVQAPLAPDEVRPVALMVAKAGLAKKAEDVTVLDVRGLTGYADYFVVMTADSDRQASAIADHVEQTMKASGVSKVGVEGYETGRWILIDYGDVVVHVQHEEERQFYALERLWRDCPLVELPESVTSGREA